MAEERVLFQDGAIVTITTARAIMMGTTYAMANITSVRAFEEKPTPGLRALIGLAFFMGGALATMSGGGAFGWGLMLIGAGLGVWWYLTKKSKHWVRIGTAGAENNAVCSHDRQWTNRVVTAVNDAIIARG